jgi:hypothetical protein
MYSDNKNTITVKPAETYTLTIFSIALTYAAVRMSKPRLYFFAVRIIALADLSIVYSRPE